MSDTPGVAKPTSPRLKAILSRLGEIVTPTLVIAGRDDWITPPAQGAERIHAGLPNSELVVFEDSGHFPFIEEHDKFVDTVAGWIAGLDR